MSKAQPTRARETEPERIPACAAFMGCLCVGHANGNDPDAACDTNEERYRTPVIPIRPRKPRAPYYQATSQAPTNTTRGPRLAGAADVAAALQDIADEDREHFVVFYMNVRHRVIQRRIVHVGSLTGVDCHPREVFKGAIAASAAAIIIAHNHPSGEVSPSRQDIELTQRLRECGELLGIPVIDHVIVSGNGFSSLAERNWK